MKVQISDTIGHICPDLQLAILKCQVVNSPSPDLLWDEILSESEEIRRKFSIEEINKRPAIAATRAAYKALGKDPNRYRPSAEALRRRIVREIPLYRLNTLVDIINLVSIRSGYSIGGFDAAKIVGDIELGVGMANEDFEAIGRGQLNIEGLPVYRDQLGGIGTPTSDNERTKITNETTELLLIINAYSGKEGLQEAVDFTLQLLKKYAGLTAYELIRPTGI